MKTTYGFPLIAFVLLFSILACSVLPSGLLPQLASATEAATTEPATQTTVFPTQPSLGEAAATEPATAIPTQAPAIQPPQPPALPQPAAQTPGAERVTFAPGSSSATGMGSLAANDVKQYVVQAAGGQTLSVTLIVISGQPALAIWGADGTVLISDHAGATQWSGTLPATQDYSIAISNQGTGQAAYSIQVSIPPVNAPTPPQPPQPPTPPAGRIRFAPGSVSATVVGRAAANESDPYVLSAQAGQTLAVELNLIQGQAILIIWGADGTVLISDHADAIQWAGPLPSSQDYFINVHNIGQERASYMMKVSVSPLGK